MKTKTWNRNERAGIGAAVADPTAITGYTDNELTGVLDSPQPAPVRSNTLFDPQFDARPMVRAREPTGPLRLKTRLGQMLALTSVAVLAAVQASGVEESAPPSTGQATTPAATTTPAPVVSSGPKLPPTQVIPREQVPLPPELSELARLIESGVDQKIILAYVQKSPLPYAASADQLVYLHDLGASQAVLQALVERGAAVPVRGTESPTTAQGSSPGASVAQAPAPAPSVTPPPPPVTGDASPFYDSLAPYGTWLNVPGYGWCWQPSVVASDPSWQPYNNEGSWLWSDAGWYWNSSYSWGWAPFHYGRWCQYPHYGWLWCPDRVWGPSWVCWRNAGDYCGWAPLPPGACFGADFGWTWGGLGVGIDCGFGLPWSCFSFVPYGHFCDRDWREHRLGEHQTRGVFGQSRVNNRFLANSSHPFSNGGVNPARVAAASHKSLQTVGVRQISGANGGAAMPGRMGRVGNSLAVYRPGSNLSVPRNPALASLRAPREFGRTLGSPTTGHSATSFAGGSPGASPRWTMPTASAGSRTASSYFRPAATAGAHAEPFHGQTPTSSARSMPSASYRSSYASPPVHAGPASHFAVPAPSYSYRSAPSWSPARPSYAPGSYASHSSPSSFGHSYSSPAMAAHSSSSFGGGRSFGSSSGGHGFSGGGGGGHGGGHR